MLATRRISEDTGTLGWTADALLRLVRSAREIRQQEVYGSESLSILRTDTVRGSYYLVMLGHTRMCPEDEPALHALSTEMGCYWAQRAVEMEPHFHPSRAFYGCEGYTLYVLHELCPREEKPVRSFCECKEFNDV
ncbi:hypothetical protein [Streptomyces sp. CFMR 7]|uniref:hypothetical protein n=1 Tax=Streptomyces sp. CFMR 7 TaxID=1649184 RepID=UPI00119E130C|nr:hypothetical protein [Streptomyces sp. CFMR 7]